MFYLLLIAGALYILFRSAETERTIVIISVSVLAVLLLYLWGAYFAWNNPSGDPHGSMFRGIEFLGLLVGTFLFCLIAWKQTHAGRLENKTAKSKQPRWMLIALALILAAVLYLTLAYLY